MSAELLKGRRAIAGATTPVASPAPQDPLAAALAAVLKPIVLDALTAAFEQIEERQQARPEYVNRSTLAELLGVCSATVGNLEAKGLPRVRVGDSVRYRPADVFRWLDERSRGEPRCPAPELGIDEHHFEAGKLRGGSRSA